MTERQKIAHLYRRLGFGATLAELDAAEKAGLNAAIDRLVDFERQPKLALEPEEFVWRDKEEADLSSYRYRLWWVSQMLATPRPLEEKLALFWHDHFAVSDNKVEFGPMMLDYLRKLRANGAGKFRTLLGEMAQDPALMRFLDMERSVKGRPNENFAREVMELFTLGIGTYSEKDVQEAARCLTGWGYVNTFWEMKGNNTDKMREALKWDRPFCSFSYLPHLRDRGSKTVLGKTGDLDGDQLLDLLAAHPATATHLARKLWEFFAYPDPEPEVVSRIAGVFRKTKGDVRETVRAIAKSKEFYSSKAERALVKCPVDHTVGLLRRLGAGAYLMAERKEPATEAKPIPPAFLEVPGGVAYLMDRQGMALLFPPDVGGWEWGKGWVSAQNMLERINLYGAVLWGQDGRWARPIWEHLKAVQPVDAKSAAQALSDYLDAGLSQTALEQVAQALDPNGKVEWIPNWDWFRGAMHRGLRVLFAAPEFHLL